MYKTHSNYVKNNHHEFLPNFCHKNKIRETKNKKDHSNIKDNNSHTNAFKTWLEFINYNNHK